MANCHQSGWSSGRTQIEDKRTKISTAMLVLVRLFRHARLYDAQLVVRLVLAVGTNGVRRDNLWATTSVGSRRLGCTAGSI